MRGNRAETYRRRDRARPGHHLQKPVRLHALAELHQVNGPPVPDAQEVEPPVIAGGKTTGATTLSERKCGTKRGPRPGLNSNPHVFNNLQRTPQKRG